MQQSPFISKENAISHSKCITKDFRLHSFPSDTLAFHNKWKFWRSEFKIQYPRHLAFFHFIWPTTIAIPSLIVEVEIQVSTYEDHTKFIRIG